MELGAELYCGFGAARDEGQRKGGAEKLYDFASSHVRTPEGGRPCIRSEASRT
jgi:hypothetical protein